MSGARHRRKGDTIEHEIVERHRAIGIHSERYPLSGANETFTFEVGGLRYSATISRFADCRIGELFLNNHKAGNQSDTNARDAAIVLSFALQFGADIHEIRKALCRDSAGRALGPVGQALDLILENAP